MKKLLGLGLLGSFVFISGCASVQTPVFGLITDKVGGPVAVGENIEAIKTGESCASTIVGLYASGDASIAAAKKVAGITKIATVDHRSSSYIVYGEYCTIVSGN